MFTFRFVLLPFVNINTNTCIWTPRLKLCRWPLTINLRIQVYNFQCNIHLCQRTSATILNLMAPYVCEHMTGMHGARGEIGVLGVRNPPGKSQDILVNIGISNLTATHPRRKLLNPPFPLEHFGLHYNLGKV